MATENVIKTLTLRGTSEGVDELIKKTGQLAGGMDDVSVASQKQEKATLSLDAAYQRLQSQYEQVLRAQTQFTPALKAANDNAVGAGKSFADMASEALSLTAHLKLAAAAAYLAIPAFRQLTNQAALQGVGALAGQFGNVAAGAGRVASALSPALSFISRISIPIAISVAAFELFNATLQKGADLLEKFGTAGQRARFGDEGAVSARLAELTKFQQETLTPDQVARAGELARRLEDAKRTLSEFAKIQFDLTEPALHLQSIWVSIVETIARGVKILPDFKPNLAGAGTPFIDPMSGAIIGGSIDAAGNVVGSSKGNLLAPSTSQLRQQGLAALSTAMSGGFAGRFAGIIPPAKEATQAVKELRGEFERLADSIARQTAATEADIKSFGQSTGEIARTRTEARLLEAAQQDILRHGGNIDDYAGRIKTLADRAGQAAEEFERLQKAGELAGAFINTFVQGLVNGDSAALSFSNSLKGLGSAITQVGAQSLGKSIVGQLGSLLGSLGGLAGPAGAAAGIGIGAGVSLLGSLFGGNQQQQQQQQQQAQQLADAATSAAKALDAVVSSFDNLVAVASGPVTSAIKNAQTQFANLQAASQASQTAAIGAFFAPGATQVQQFGALQAFQQAGEAVARANDQLKEFNIRTIETARAALRGTDAVSDTAKAIEDLNKQADDLKEAMTGVTNSADDAARAVQEDLNVALQRLSNTFAKDLTRQLNQLTGQGFLNDMADLIQTISDAQSLGVDPNLVAAFTQAKVQDIVNQAQLVGDAFTNLTQQFPQLTMGVHEFAVAATDSSEQIIAASKSIQDYLNSLLVGPESLLSPRKQLELAQKQFEAQLASAQAGNLEALQTITATAETLRKAGLSVFGSAAGYQSVLQAIQTGLGGLIPQAAGGWITGGVPFKDSVALAAGGHIGMPGEYVVQRSAAQANAGSLMMLNSTGRWPANDNVARELARMGASLSVILGRIADLEQEGNRKIEENTAATHAQTMSLNREQRFASRKKA